MKRLEENKNYNIYKSKAQEIRLTNDRTLTNIEWLHIEFYRISFLSKNLKHQKS